MKTYLVIPDVHIPFHCVTTTKLITKIIKEINPDGLVQLGDFSDCFQISSYDKDPERKNTLADDIDECNKILTIWASHLKSGAQVHLLEGNHEYRLSRYISRNCRELHGLVPDWPTLLKIKLRNETTNKKWVWHKYTKWDSCQIGDCTLMHGFYFNQHVAMTNLAKYRRNTISGHTHRVQHVFDGTNYAISLGHVSDEKQTAHQPTPTGWTKALAILHVDNYGKTFVDVLPIVNGRVIVYGKAISV